MLNQFSRTQLLLGKYAMEKLKNSRVAVFGIGGAGGYVCEALVRSGVGAFDLIDDDKVCLTNLNRQIIATRKTVGKYKADKFSFEKYDYVVDAVDTVTAKLEIIMQANRKQVPVISCRSHCICPPGAKHKCTERRDIPGSVSFVPSVAGLILAGEVVKDLTQMV